MQSLFAGAVWCIIGVSRFLPHRVKDSTQFTSKLCLVGNATVLEVCLELLLRPMGQEVVINRILDPETNSQAMVLDGFGWVDFLPCGKFLGVVGSRLVAQKRDPKPDN